MFNRRADCRWAVREEASVRVGIEPEAIVKRMEVSYKEDLTMVSEMLRLEGRRTLEMLQNIWSICLIG